MDERTLENIYQERLEERLIAFLAEKYGMDYQSAMNVYYNSSLAEKIYEGEYGIQYLDYKVLAEILEKAEPGLFQSFKASEV